MNWSLDLHNSQENLNDFRSWQVVVAYGCLNDEVRLDIRSTGGFGQFSRAAQRKLVPVVGRRATTRGAFIIVPPGWGACRT